MLDLFVTRCVIWDVLILGEQVTLLLAVFHQSRPHLPWLSEVTISTLHGNTEGLKTSESRALLALYRRKVQAQVLISPELARSMTEISREISRQLGLMIDRRGRITHVIVGDAHQLFIPDLRRHRAGSGRLRGIRLVHTHLRGEGLSRDDLTDLTLLRLDAVAIVQSRTDGLPGPVECATVKADASPGEGETPWSIAHYPSVHEMDLDFGLLIREVESALSQRDSTIHVGGGEGCIVIGVTTQRGTEAETSLDELERLAHTAGLQVMDRVLQVRRKFDHRYVIGKGKLQEILVRAMQLGAEVLVFDQELAPSQLRNIATDTDLKVVDRTQLILDIFAQRAQTKEGKLQVELAQLRYRKPRLAIMPTAMSRLTGGIGGRGPGETKLEINRRRANERQSRIEKQLRKLGKHRSLRRARRKRVGLPQIAIVGYTNAGKSTLLNTMTRSKVDAEDKLFATLDPTSRRLRFPEEREVILTDTVGFIRNLPKDLLEAFRSTLEEAVDADFILHVLDASSPEMDLQAREVQNTLVQLGADATPTILVLNKIDALDPMLWTAVRDRFRFQENSQVAHSDVILCSALTSKNLSQLIVAIERMAFRERSNQEESDAQAQA